MTYKYVNYELKRRIENKLFWQKLSRWIVESLDSWMNEGVAYALTVVN